MKFATLLFVALPTLLHAQHPLVVAAFEDRNGNGIRDVAERPVPGVAISNQLDVVATDASGAALLGRGTSGLVFVSVPDRYRSVGPFWRAVADGDSVISFALRPALSPGSFTFVHASDPHIAPANVARTKRFREMVDSIRPAFAIVTGDLVRDAMSQTEELSRSYFELFKAEMRTVAPLWTVPGNHDHFGLVRSRSNIPKAHPLYDRGMYRSYLGPDYYSFNFGGVHFVGLNTLVPDDSAYYGRVDSVQLAWLQKDLALVPPGVPIVTFNHIPMVSGWEIFTGFVDMPLVASVRRNEAGRTTHRHTVANVLEVLKTMRGHRWVLALGGHIHAGEKLVFQQDGVATRFEQAAAIVGGGALEDYLVIPSGFSLYTVRNGVIDAGRFIRLDHATAKR
jgi:hypothetical protein